VRSKQRGPELARIKVMQAVACVRRTTGANRRALNLRIAMTDPRLTFRRLHEQGCFVMPNPWDAGTARCLAKLGFAALATTSAGFAFTRGLPDSSTALSLDSVLAHVREIVAAAGAVPVNADFQACYAVDAAGVGRNVARCIAAGCSGLSIEDASGDRNKPLFELAEAIDRVRAARAAVDAAGGQVVLTARAECFLIGHRDALRESIRRLCAYAEAGADVLFAPGMQTRDEIRAVVDAVKPKPVNVLISGAAGLSVAELAGLGVRRVSVGSALARTAWGAFLRAARELAATGTFAGLNGAVPFAELNAMFDEPPA
jgi:2-methylisocitrate lyase-like PEP mutase family enzyme